MRGETIEAGRTGTTLSNAGATSHMGLFKSELKLKSTGYINLNYLI